MAVNKNIYWSQLIFQRLKQAGIEYVCVSPGSRHTSMVFALHESGLKSFVHIDERSSAFFALGLAKSSGRPVVLLSTSGTAAAEFYPAAVEARMSRTPLLIITADRPPELRGTGANQTIFQEDMYAGHVCAFFDPGLPSLEAQALLDLTDTVNNALASLQNGPVHLNLPFEKPFEPDAGEDVKDPELEAVLAKIPLQTLKHSRDECPEAEKAADLISAAESGLIYCGWGTYTEDEIRGIQELSHKCAFPIVADGAGPFSTVSAPNVLRNASVFLGIPKFREKLKVSVLIRFGGASTSDGAAKYWAESDAAKISVHALDHHDPDRVSEHCRCTPAAFLRTVLPRVGSRSLSGMPFFQIDTLCDLGRREFLNNRIWNFEGSLYDTVISEIKDPCTLVLGNSSIVRDQDLFGGTASSPVKVVVNRGASGIDGVISTALGAAAEQEPVVCIIGDLSFFYDLTALHTLSRLQLPVCIVLVNNRGGGIFRRLPVSSYPDILEKFFITPADPDYTALVSAFEIDHVYADSPDSLRSALHTFFGGRKPAVIEVPTDSLVSAEIRKEYLSKMRNALENIFLK